MSLMWLLSPTLAYNFSELIEAHAVDTYAEFIDGNEATLRALPPPEIAIQYYQTGGERGSAPVESLYDVFCRVRDDEASHVDSMKECQDPEVRSRARIVELGAMVTAAAVFAASAVTVETVETVESLAAPVVSRVERQVVNEIERDLEGVEERVEATIEREGADFQRALYDAETGGNRWQSR